MKQYVYTIWCEWDLGLEHTAYVTEELAIKAIKEFDFDSCGVDGDAQELIDGGLVGTTQLELITS